MIYPTAKQLSENGKYNRYEVALAAARCARRVTDEYVKQRIAAERSTTSSKETDKPINVMIDKELRDEKAVKTAIKKIYEKKYVIVRRPDDYVPEVETEEAEEAEERVEDAEFSEDEVAELEDEDLEDLELLDFENEEESDSEAEAEAEAEVKDIVE